MIGGGVLCAGLAGGAVTLVLGFPIIWAVLTAVGAFLLAGSGVATLIQHHGENENGGSSFALAVARISEELEAAEDVLQSHDVERFFVRHTLAVVQWEKYGDALVGHPELHREARAAYRAIDAMNNRGAARVRTVGGGMSVTVDQRRSDEAVRAIQHALMAMPDDT